MYNGNATTGAHFTGMSLLLLLARHMVLLARNQATCHVLSGCVRVGCVPSSLTLNCENNSRKCEVIRLNL